MLMMGFFVILWVLKPSADPKVNPAQAAAQWNRITARSASCAAGSAGSRTPSSTDPVDQAVIRIRPAMARSTRAKVRLKSEARREPTRRCKASGQASNRPWAAGCCLKSHKRHSTGSGASVGSNRQHHSRHRNIFLVKGTPRAMIFRILRRNRRWIFDSPRPGRRRLSHQGQRRTGIMRVQGCSIFEPVRKRTYTEESQSNNRRVEVEATATLVEDMQDKSASAVEPMTTTASGE